MLKSSQGVKPTWFLRDMGKFCLGVDSRVLQNKKTVMMCLTSGCDVKMEIPVLVRSLKSSTLGSTSFQLGNISGGVVSAVVEQSRRRADMVALGHGKIWFRG